MLTQFCAILFCTNIQLTDCHQPLVGEFTAETLAEIVVDASVKDHMIVWRSCGEKAVVERELEEILKRRTK